MSDASQTRTAGFVRVRGARTHDLKSADVEVPRDALGDVVRYADWTAEVGPGAGKEGGRAAAAGPPAEIARSPESRIAPYLAVPS
jgi:excinuclease UvrABC ATPase subunit